ncbi:uncharacterized protein THITE_2125850 [Thermothielavioides terrestris NRRL 8126]|uniref:HypA-like protein n=1 Tax=Thermothielavioides terrestris (strain ATCC 38088 / NRRL 8126) TaxID=578455 RepID=G2QR61_THETT|nr:uncharacterized protein THITE_2125850 [Thermothielavioides terrestris NRRL 8126]AEO63315.1 hypothetical protein THITE_2125850 [Thermothielavioides terrestris NRRL 8126]
MASIADLPYKMHVTPDNTGLWHIQQTDEAAKKVSELLQEDMEKHHVFFNFEGFHNHIPHHLLALYGTGAAPPALAAAYANNASYQRPALAPHSSGSGAAADDEEKDARFLPWPEAARPYLGREEFYPDFLRFFQREIRRESSSSSGSGSSGGAGGGGWKAVVRRFLFGVDATGKTGGQAADDEMMVRLFAGVLHPLIQLMYGVEWAQEAVVAEALAQTAVHAGYLGEFLLGAERVARERGGPQQERVGVMELLEEVRRNEKIVRAARDGFANKIRMGVLAGAKDEMMALAARVTVRPEEVEERTAEMFNAALFVAAAAALAKEGKQPKFDFVLMHHVNASPFFVTISAADWVPAETKARLLEWKIRMDLLQYATCGVAELSLDKLPGYQPKKPEAGGSLAEIIARLHTFPDDGHAIKLDMKPKAGTG